MLIETSLSQFKEYAKHGNLVAIVAKLPADLETPVSTFIKLAHDEENTFLFESAEQGAQVGRFSILGLRPIETLTARDSAVTLSETSGKTTVFKNTSMTEAIKQRLKEKHLVNHSDLEGFDGGYVGYLSYENVRHFDSIDLKQKASYDMPEGIFLLPSELVVFDHYRKSLSIVKLTAIDKKQTLDATYQKTIRRLEALVRKLQQPLNYKKQVAKKKVSIKSNMTKASFMNKVRRIKNYIRAGDCIQVVLSQRFSIKGISGDLGVYRSLRSVNPSPYMFYFRSGKYRLVGSSPELLVKKIGNKAETRPIAGTRPRGRTEKEDLKHAHNLKKSVKEMAEHLMLVDLGRNDLGRVCEYNSIHVDDYARIENYSHVMHLVSDVTGKLMNGKTAFDLLAAGFPAGTLSGAPKIRAMQIINELEPDNRGPYGGCVGYFGFNKDMDMCITIRTLVLTGHEAYLQAGAGIVKDSNPQKEYEESWNKARALIKAIELQDYFL